MTNYLVDKHMDPKTGALSSDVTKQLLYFMDYVQAKFQGKDGILIFYLCWGLSIWKINAEVLFLNC